jgi:hypothetical protein
MCAHHVRCRGRVTGRSCRMRPSPGTGDSSGRRRHAARFTAFFTPTGGHAPEPGALSDPAHRDSRSPGDAAACAGSAPPGDPDGDPGRIFERALTLLLDDVARKKLAATPSPRPTRTDPRSRSVPAEVKRKVWLRDHGQCAFVSLHGRRCRERAFLEFHHVEPYAAGGETTASNISLRCREHNVHEAERVFGRWEPAVVNEAPAVYSIWRGAALSGHSDMWPARPGASDHRGSRPRRRPGGRTGVREV